MNEEAQEVHLLLCEFVDVFYGDYERTDLVKHKIDTGDTAQPPRRLSLSKKEEAERAVNQQGVIQPSQSARSSPVVFVKIMDGGIHFCVDYRKLNDGTIKDSYPLPRIDNSIKALSGAKWLSTLGLKSGYWQVELDAKDKEKTAFSIGRGL